jgi:protein kinase C substrate 80K-H
MASLWVLLSLVGCFAPSLSTSVRGIPLEKASLYVEGKSFTCLNGAETIPFEYINDNYCDCSDGSDEPGTSACPNSLFYCPNKGHSPTYLLSSRVNDHYCDCCDGSDEWGTGLECPNTCEDLGKQAAEERKKKQAIHSQGYDKMLEYAEEGQRKREDSQNELKQIENDLGVVRMELSALQQAKEEAEEPEKAAKDKHKQEWEELMATQKASKREENARKTFNLIDTDGDGRVTTQEIMARAELDNDGDGEVSQEEASHYLDELESVDFKDFLERVWDVIDVNEKKRKEDQEEKKKILEEDKEGREEEEEDEEDDEREEEKDEGHSEGMPPYDENTQALIVAADKARNEFNEAEKRKNDLESKQKDTQRYLDKDFGEMQQFSPLYEKCYEYTDREYVYKLCLYQKVTQRSKDGGRETTLGDWEGWGDRSRKSHWVMRYTNGEKCWNGPSRSAIVTLRCGVEETITTANEPSRCEYAMEFLTPAMCLEKSPYPHNEL